MEVKQAGRQQPCCRALLASPRADRDGVASPSVPHPRSTPSSSPSSPWFRSCELPRDLTLAASSRRRPRLSGLPRAQPSLPPASLTSPLPPPSRNRAPTACRTAAAPLPSKSGRRRRLQIRRLRCSPRAPTQVATIPLISSPSPCLQSLVLLPIHERPRVSCPSSTPAITGVTPATKWVGRAPPLVPLDVLHLPMASVSSNS